MKKMIFICMAAGFIATACNPDWFKKEPKNEEKEVVIPDDSVSDSTLLSEDTSQVKTDSVQLKH
ncbi:MAG TPA: hypothetical protein PLF48_08095 [Chitinophagales bacterium]|nr:hypothetical protein [Chitinophagales bacterium]